MKKEGYRGVGVMSGSSLDGVDVADCYFWQSKNGQWNYVLLDVDTYPYGDEWRERLSNITDALTFARLNIDYGHFLGLTVRRFLIENDLTPDFVVSHGHTIFHDPERHFTAQIGSGETMATYLPCPLVTDLRTRDLALGGQGAPLVPFGEKALFDDCKLFLNLGGIANLSILPDENVSFSIISWKKEDTRHLAFDVCGCNIVLNHLASIYARDLHYDPDGAIAGGGSLEPALLVLLEQESYYSLIPPKSLGREWVESRIFPLLDTQQWSVPDLLHTYCYFIAHRVGAELDRFGVRNEQIMITGGGAHNQFLMHELEGVFSARNIQILPTQTEVINYKEALIFAFLGMTTLLGLPNVLPDATGASKAGICGAIHLPQTGGYSIL